MYLETAQLIAGFLLFTYRRHSQACKKEISKPSLPSFATIGKDQSAMYQSRNARFLDRSHDGLFELLHYSNQWLSQPFKLQSIVFSIVPSLWRARGRGKKSDDGNQVSVGLTKRGKG